ncbi:hypothetical protein IWZ00DRAFT_297243 [Phyllosticta capitalensis]
MDGPRLELPFLGGGGGCSFPECLAFRRRRGRDRHEDGFSSMHASSIARQDPRLDTAGIGIRVFIGPTATPQVLCTARPVLVITTIFCRPRSEHFVCPFAITLHRRLDQYIIHIRTYSGDDGQTGWLRRVVPRCCLVSFYQPHFLSFLRLFFTISFSSLLLFCEHDYGWMDGWIDRAGCCLSWIPRYITSPLVMSPFCVLCLSTYLPISSVAHIVSCECNAKQTLIAFAIVAQSFASVLPRDPS